MKADPRWSVVAVLVVCVAMATSAGSRRLAAQDWRATGLAAFDTVWRTVNETYHDPTFGGLDWDAVRDELRPRAEVATSADDQRAAIREMLSRLGQSHFALLTTAGDLDAPQGPASVPFDVRMVAGDLLVTRLPAGVDVPVGVGDAIRRIDGEDVAEVLADVLPGDPRRALLSWRRATRALSGLAGTRVRLTVQSPGNERREVDIDRVVGPGVDVTLGNLPPMRAHLEAVDRRTEAGRPVGVIRFNVWMAALGEPFAQAVDRFRSSDGLVVDLRGNPGGLADMTRGIAGHLVNEPVVLGRMRMRGLDLAFPVNPRRSTLDGRAVSPYAGPVAILVDELTASASECFAGGLQALGRARVFGTRTSGQALPAATQQLVTGDVLLYAVGDFVTSTGQRLEGAGVVPDVEVTLTPGGLASGHDAERAALDWIDDRASSAP